MKQESLVMFLKCCPTTTTNCENSNVDSVPTRADKIATKPLPKVMEHTVAVLLVHLGVNVETRVAELSDLLCKQLDSLRRVAEYNRLIDL